MLSGACAGGPSRNAETFPSDHDYRHLRMLRAHLSDPVEPEDRLEERRSG